jgi:hypothetical protein
VPLSPASVAVVFCTWPPKSIGSWLTVTWFLLQLLTMVLVNGSTAEEL